MVSRPGIGTTFAQQAANLWVIKQKLHQPLLIDLGATADPIRVDGCPLPVCVLTRAPGCRLFPEAAGLVIGDKGYMSAFLQHVSV